MPNSWGHVAKAIAKAMDLDSRQMFSCLTSISKHGKPCCIKVCLMINSLPTQVSLQVHA